MEDDREEQRATAQRIKEMHDILSDLRVQSAVNASKLA